METLQRTKENDYNKSLLKTVAILFSHHNELLIQLTNLVKCSETNDIDRYITDKEIANLISAESINSADANAQDLIELIELMKKKMSVLLNRTLHQAN